MMVAVHLFLQSWTRCQCVRGQTSTWRRGNTHRRVVFQTWTLHVSDYVVDCSWSVWIDGRLNDAPSVHALGAKTARRCAAPQLVLTRYKLLEIEHGGLYGNILRPISSQGSRGLRRCRVPQACRGVDGLWVRQFWANCRSEVLCRCCSAQALAGVSWQSPHSTLSWQFVPLYG